MIIYQQNNLKIIKLNQKNQPKIQTKTKKNLHKYLIENAHYLIAHKLDKLDKFIQEIKH